MSDSTVKRDAKGRLLPGHRMGRPAGRTELERVRALIEPHRDAIIACLVRAVKEGNVEPAAVKAAETLLERLSAKPRPQAERVHIPGLRDAPTTQGKADAILGAMADGQISAEAGRAALAMLADYAKVRSVDDIDARLRALEQRGPDRARVLEPLPEDGSDLV
jgi:hypothetical protein